MQSNQMRHHQTQQHQRQGNHVQGKEAVQGDVRHVEVTAYPRRQIRADHRNRSKQVNDYLRTPKRHLAPRQQIAHERLGHQGQENQRAKHPHQFARAVERAVNQATEHVQIHHDEEHRCACGVHVANDPAARHVTHDVFH